LTIASRATMKNALLIVPLLIGAALLIGTQTRGVDPDEWEHLHAACCVFRGETPYRDFFEHHAPAIYYLLQPILHATGCEPPALAWSRSLMWLFSMATLAVTAALAYRTSGKTAAAVAPALLCCTTVFFGKSIEVRPDAPASFLLVLAAYGLIALPSRRSAWAASAWSLAIGCVLGLAVLFTQKSIVPAAAMIVAQAVFLQATTGRKIIQTGILMFGASAACLAAFGLFARVGAGEAFFHATVVQLWTWPVRESPLTALRPTLAADLPLWLALAAAVAVAGWRVFHATNRNRFGSPRQNRQAFLATVAVLSFLGGLSAQAVYAQYYLLWFPMAAALAAGVLSFWARGAVERWGRMFLHTKRLQSFTLEIVLFGLIAFLVVESQLAVRAIHSGDAGSLAHLIAEAPRVGFSVFAIVAMVILPAVASIACIRGRCGVAIFCLTALGFAYAGLRNVDALCWSNREQLAEVAAVNRLAGPTGTVFDGYTGLGAFRRHAYYYWWLNPYSLALMSAEERGPKLLAALEKSPPAVVCFDENIAALPEPVERWLKARYREVQSPIYAPK
jgi:hypothetical protein